MSSTEERELPVYPELTPELATSLLVYSFHLSQGDLELQSCIFQYLHLQYPDWTISGGEKFEKILAMTIPIAKRFAQAGQRRPELNTSPYKLHATQFELGDETKDIDDEQVKETASQQLKAMKIILNESHLTQPEDRGYIQDLTSNPNIVNMNYPQVLDNIDRFMTNADERFVKKGRLIRYHEKYVINGEKTRVPIYDQMMQDIRHYRGSRVKPITI